MLGHDVELGVWWRLATGFAADEMRPPYRPAAQHHALRSGPVLPPPQSSNGDAPIEFRNDDAGYIEWIQAHPNGFVVNTTPCYSRSYLKLHRASCKFVSVLQSGYSTWTSGQYIKVCSNDRSTLESWARDEVGGQLQDLCYCRP